MLMMIYIYEVITTQMNLRDKSDWKVMSCLIERMRIKKAIEAPKQ